MICTKLSNKDHLSHRSVSLRTVTTCSTSVFLMKNETHEFLTADSMCCGICGFAEVEVEETGEGEPRERLTNAHDEPGCYRPWWFPPMLHSYLLSSRAKGCSTSTVREARAETVSVSSCNCAPARAQPLGTLTVLTDFQYLPKKHKDPCIICYRNFSSTVLIRNLYRSNSE